MMPATNMSVVLGLLRRPSRGRLQLADRVDDDRALPAGVERDLAERLLERAAQDVDAGRLVAERLDLVEGGDRVDRTDAATGDDALLDGGAWPTGRPRCGASSP